MYTAHLFFKPLFFHIFFLQIVFCIRNQTFFSNHNFFIFFLFKSFFFCKEPFIGILFKKIFGLFGLPVSYEICHVMRENQDENFTNLWQKICQNTIFGSSSISFHFLNFKTSRQWNTTVKYKWEQQFLQRSKDQ